MTILDTLTNKSGDKGNKTMKFGRLIEYNMRNILLQYFTRNVVEKLVLEPFSKTSKLRISLDHQSEMSHCLHCMSKSSSKIYKN